MTESAETATTATGSAPDGQGNGSAAGGPAGGGPAGRDVAPDAQAEGSPPAPVTEPGQPDITIRETRVYRGPNFYSYEPAVHMVVDIGRLEQLPTDTAARIHRVAARHCCPGCMTTSAPAAGTAASSSG